MEPYDQKWVSKLERGAVLEAGIFTTTKGFSRAWQKGNLTKKEETEKWMRELRQMEKAMAAHSRILAWGIQGQGILVGCCLWGCTESDTTEAT